jgi:hypothetical protein
MDFGIHLKNYFMINNWRELLLGPNYLYHKILIKRSRERHYKPFIVKIKEGTNRNSKRDYLMNLNKYENTFSRFLTLRFVYLKHINKLKSGKSQYFIQMLKNETAYAKY